MTQIYGSRQKNKSAWRAYLGWGFLAGFFIAIFMVIIVSISSVQKQIFFDTGNDIDAIVIGYDYFRDAGNGSYLLQIKFKDIDGNEYEDFFNSKRYPTEGSAKNEIGKTVHIKTNGSGKFISGTNRPEIPIIMYILFSLFFVMGIIGVILIVKYQWLIIENRVYKKGKYCIFKVLAFEKKRLNDPYYRLKIEINTETEKKVLFTSSRFKEGEAAFCFALPKLSKIYRAKYLGNKVIIIEDFDYMRECLRSKAIDINYEAEEYKPFRELMRNKLYDEMLISEKITPYIRKKYELSGKFLIPSDKEIIEKDKINLYVCSSIDKISEKYVGKKIKVFHNPALEEINRVEMAIITSNNENLSDPFSERDSLNLLSKYGNWFELNGYIEKVFKEERVVICKVEVPRFS